MQEGSSLDVAIESFLSMDKQCQLAGEVAGSRKSFVDIVEIFFKDGAWKKLNNHIGILSKRRGRLKQVGNLARSRWGQRQRRTSWVRATVARREGQSCFGPALANSRLEPRRQSMGRVWLGSQQITTSSSMNGVGSSAHHIYSLLLVRSL